jgi:glycosyltransferase involved in cell wall biosynthesis
MEILIVEPFLTGSHATWAREYAEHSKHDVVVLGLEGRHWKWRMHGGAVTLAGRFLDGGYSPDLILATDMLDLTTFLALTRQKAAGVRAALYFHENQITYPWSEKDRDRARDRDVHYGFINFVSALAADAVAFNSEYHRTSFLSELGPFLSAFPDYNETDAVEVIRGKCRVLYLGVDLRRFDEYRRKRAADRVPLVLWNHRWEYDKRPEDFFKALFVLQDEGLDFEVAVLGESFDVEPPIFAEAAERLGDRIVQMGFARDFSAYAKWLWRADIVPVTSIHDFFGASVVQAIYCNCYPLLPARLAYREHIPAEHHGEHVYEDFSELVCMLRDRITNIEATRQVRTQHFVRRYDWKAMAPQYDEFFRLVAGRPPICS